MSVADECRLNLTVSVPWETVEKVRDELITDSMAKARIPGFRPGKVPVRVFAQHYKREILDAMKGGFAQEQVLTEVAQKDLVFAHGPEIRDLRLVEDDRLEIDATVEVFPRFELGEYRNIEVSVPKTLPIDQLIDVRIEKLRREQGSFANVDPRPAQETDHVLISIEVTTEDGEPVLDISERLVDLEQRNVLPGGFREAILGMSPGEESEFQYVCTEDLFARRIAGETLRCRVDLHQVGKFELPELDDEFAQDVSDEHETLDDLRARVRAEAEQALNGRIEESVRQQVMDALAATHPMPLPERNLEERVQQALANLKQNLALKETGENVKIDNLAYLTRELDPELTEDDIDQVRAATANMVRSEQVLDRIARLENISVSLEELDQQIRAIAEAQRLSRDQLARHLVDTGQIHILRNEIRRTKTLDYVVGEAIRVPEDDEADSESSDAEDESTLS